MVSKLHLGAAAVATAGFVLAMHTVHTYAYRISSYSFRGNYSFLDLEIQRSQCINVRKLFKGRNYMRKYSMYSVDRQ